MSNILNLKYDWNIDTKTINDSYKTSTIPFNSSFKNIIVISLCLKTLSKTDDNFYNILDINNASISLGDYIIKLRNLLETTKEDYDIFSILKDIDGIINNKK